MDNSGDAIHIGRRAGRHNAGRSLGRRHLGLATTPYSIRHPAPGGLGAKRHPVSRTTPVTQFTSGACRSITSPLSSRRKAPSTCAGTRARCSERGNGIAGFYDGVPMHWMRDWSMPFPFVVRSGTRLDAARHRRQRVRRLLPGRHRLDVRALAACRGRSHCAPGDPRPHLHAADRGCDRGRTPARRALRPAALAGRHDRHRREPLCAARGTRRHRTPEDPGVQRLLPRHRGRDFRAARRRPRRQSSGAARAGGRPDAARARRRVQRPRRHSPRRCRIATSPASSPNR